MPTGQQYPPHKLPGIDQFLTAPEALNNVTISEDDPDSPWLEIRATTTHPDTHQQIRIAIKWKPTHTWEGDTLHAIIGKHATPYNDGRIHPADLGLDTDTREGAILWAAFVELREAYRQANQIRDDYINRFREYAIGKLDHTTRGHSRPSKEHPEALRSQRGIS